MDVKNAFLHGDLQETVYMLPPLGYACLAWHDCHFKKSLYGLKQATRGWFDKFHSAVLHTNFYQSPNDSSLFIQRTSCSCTILLLHVDDKIITGNNAISIKELKNHLMGTSKMKDLGHLTCFLELEISLKMVLVLTSESMQKIFFLLPVLQMLNHLILLLS